MLFATNYGVAPASATFPGHDTTHRDRYYYYNATTTVVAVRARTGVVPGGRPGLSWVVRPGRPAGRQPPTVPIPLLRVPARSLNIIKNNNKRGQTLPLHHPDESRKKIKKKNHLYKTT